MRDLFWAKNENDGLKEDLQDVICEGWGWEK